jgi:glycosyltransferase involved in cell wall biosynthesis
MLTLVGRLSPEKQVDKLIAALPDIRRQVPEVQLVIIGDGPTRQALTQQVEQLGLTDCVHLVGWQSDLKMWYQATDVLTLTSSTEGLPNVLLEGMALGVPIAATPVGAIPDLLDGGRCGRLIQQDSTTWADGLAELLMNKPARSHLSQAARHRVETEFSFARRMNRMMAEYDQLLTTTSESTGRQAA